MFQLVASKSAARAMRIKLVALLSKDAERVNQRLATPAGAFHAKILVREDLDLWAYITEQPYNDAYNFWLNVGKPSWQTAIQINIPVTRTLHCAGQLVRDEDGKVLLAHRGGLGGGKFPVSVEVFRDLITEFETDDVADGKKLLQYYVLGSPSDEDFLARLSAYVHEAVRIRDLRKRQSAFKRALAAVGRDSDTEKPLGEFRRTR